MTAPKRKPAKPRKVEAWIVVDRYLLHVFYHPSEPAEGEAESWDYLRPERAPHRVVRCEGWIK